MRIEEEWRDAETDDGDPEVDQVRDEDCESDVEQKCQGPHSEVNRRAGESRTGVS